MPCLCTHQFFWPGVQLSFWPGRNVDHISAGFVFSARFLIVPYSLSNVALYAAQVSVKVGNIGLRKAAEFKDQCTMQCHAGNCAQQSNSRINAHLCAG